VGSLLETNGFAAVLAFAAVFLGVVTFVLAFELLRSWLTQRTVRSRLGPIKDPDKAAASILLDNEITAGPLSGTIQKFSEALGVAPLIRQADSSWSVTGFFVMSFGITLAFWVAMTVIGVSPFVRIPIALVAGTFPYGLLAVKRTLRLRAFEANLPESVDLLARAIRAGHPLSSGIRMVSEEGPEPVASEFRTLFEEQRFGIPFDEALGGMMDRVDLIDVRIFATAVLVQREVGGNLAEVLGNIATTMRVRFSIRRQLQVYTAQGRMSGYVLAVMPFVVGLALWALDKEYMGTLFFSAIGRFMLIVAFIFWIIGFFWIRKIVNIEI
jgi:tight adherence protein B